MLENREFEQALTHLLETIAGSSKVHQTYRQQLVIEFIRAGVPADLLHASVRDAIQASK